MLLPGSGWARLSSLGRPSHQPRLPPCSRAPGHGPTFSALCSRRVLDPDPADSGRSAVVGVWRAQTLVLDEADLLLSYGYEPDLQLLAPLVRRMARVGVRVDHPRARPLALPPHTPRPTSLTPEALLPRGLPMQAPPSSWRAAASCHLDESARGAGWCCNRRCLGRARCC